MEVSIEWSTCPGVLQFGCAFETICQTVTSQWIRNVSSRYDGFTFGIIVENRVSTKAQRQTSELPAYISYEMFNKR